MDPKKNLCHQLELAQKLVNGIPNQTDQTPYSEADVLAFETGAMELAELVLSLHDWQVKGGFPALGVEVNDPAVRPWTPQDILDREG